MSLDQLVETDVDISAFTTPYEETSDPSVRAHIVNPPMNMHIWQIGMSAQDIVDIARTNGVEIVALCGHRWVPKHNPDKFDACESCVRIAGDLMRGNNE